MRTLQIENDERLSDCLVDRGFKLLAELTGNGLNSVYVFIEEPEIYGAILELQELLAYE